MTHFGTIESYDNGKGSGTIAPEQGGDVLPFGKDDLQQQAGEPRQGQRWGYETRQVDGGTVSATNLRQQEQEQVRQQGEKVAGRQQAH
ncbi:cold-shock protein [Qipengyuania sp. YG27]|uniref:Cold-shock protein n=1 Tax=Qipengyuania mesophila TaxID=2867246 RepID=A0ABS7JR78_9SPHN|nr:cold-shock protein [Qipengyuania mesophila]MBX7500145.1 cold-shock protein [Qipengyuania mesophila]